MSDNFSVTYQNHQFHLKRSEVFPYMSDMLELIQGGGCFLHPTLPKALLF